MSEPGLDSPLPLDILREYAAENVRLALTSPWVDTAPMQRLADVVAVDARESGCSAESLVLAFSLAWEVEGSWRDLPHSWQIGVYERALAFLLERYVDA